MTAFFSAKQCKFLTVALSLASATSLPAHAQTLVRQSQGSDQYVAPTAEDGLRTVAAALNEKRGEAFRRRDSAAVAQFYTSDATYVELLPKLEVMRGRAEIKNHFDELLAAQSSNLTYSVVSAELTANDTMSVGGDYVLTAGGNKQIQGHFFQVLRREDGGWKIATNVFARPDPVTVREVDAYRGN